MVRLICICISKEIWASKQKVKHFISYIVLRFLFFLILFLISY